MQSGCDVARPHAVRYGHDDLPRGRSCGDGFGHRSRHLFELGFGRVACQSDPFDGIGRVGIQVLASSIGMRCEEFVDSGGVGVRIVCLDAGFRVARHGDRAGCDEIRQRLRGTACAGVVVHQHVRVGMRRPRFVVFSEVARSKVRRFGFYDGAHEGQALFQQRMDIGLLAR